MRRILGSRPRSHASPPIAILSDVHANRQALDAVLRAARETGAREWWCLGDVVGYGADPVHCLHACLGGASRCLAGNHDLGASGEADIAQFAGEAGDAVAWTRRVIGRVGAAQIARLRPADASGDVPLFHASPRDPVWEYILTPALAMAALDRIEAPLAFTGHTHLPAAWRLTPEGRLEGGFVDGEGLLPLTEGRWLINPGAVGQPRDGDARAAWALLDSDARTIRFCRTPYDVAGAQNAILSAGLPTMLATRLAAGR
jgi:diadenosine tetraphosphatase ApaH/serine/threonine PP2A family protein phosphatase